MKIQSISNNFNLTKTSGASFKSRPKINGGGGIIPESKAYKPVNIEKSSVLGKYIVSTAGKVLLGFAAVVTAGAYLAHKIDKELIQTGKLGYEDIYNPDSDRLYM